ncbi:MAG: glycoside hydrolase family 3 N-terminal domain-containing protein [Geminicoccaceae bacterium]
MPEHESGERIEALLAAMTLEEKIGQMTLVSAGAAVTGPGGTIDHVEAVRAGRAGAICNLLGREQTRALQRIAVQESRLGIPLLISMDVLHGYRTIFPVPLAEAGTFDPALWRATARAAAVEAAADGIALTFAPMLDVARDPRWGRIVETPGEDPWLAARYARAKVQGFQNDDLAAADSLAAVAKHLAGYGAVTAGREYAPVDISERSLREIYLPPFAEAVAVGVAGIMPAFHNLAGIPMTANRAVLTGLVRGEWGFAGVQVSDYAAIAELVVQGVAADLAEAAALALRAGVDIDLMGNAYAGGLPAALRRGLVEMADLDGAVRRILALKLALGLFEDPYRRGRSLGAEQVAAHRALALEAARRAIVLLTHRTGVLPLAQSGGPVAVIGPLADAPADMLGPWAADGRPEEAVTILAGIRAAFPGREILHAAGLANAGGDSTGLAAALDVARTAEVVILCLGEARSMSGEAASRADTGLPGRQAELARALLEIGKPVLVILSSGRPLTAPWLFERAEAALATWFLGSEAGNAVAAVLTGAHNPTGRLPVSWPVDVGQIPIFFAMRPSGRPASPAEHFSARYIDLPVEPQFAFGHGLSYTRFAYRNLRAHPSEPRVEDRIAIEVEIENEGALAGEETVFLFISDPVASVARPLLELRGVARIALAAGMRGTVGFELSSRDLQFLGPDLTVRLEAGTFEIHVGPSAASASLLKTSVRLVSDGAAIGRR